MKKKKKKKKKGSRSKHIVSVHSLVYRIESDDDYDDVCWFRKKKGGGEEESRLFENIENVRVWWWPLRS